MKKVLSAIGLIVVIPVEWVLDMCVKIVGVIHTGFEDAGIFLLKQYNEPVK